MTIGEVIQEYPSTIPVLLEAGVHCVGCHVAAWEKLEDGFRGHGMSEERIDEILGKLNAVVSDDNIGDEVVMTSLAVDKLKEVLKEQGKEDCGLKIDVIPGGCNGMQYSFGIMKEGLEGDKTLEMGDVKVFISKESFELLKGSKIDYVDSLTDAGFRITNPNAKSSCGCGKSFS